MLKLARCSRRLPTTKTVGEALLAQYDCDNQTYRKCESKTNLKFCGGQTENRNFDYSERCDAATASFADRGEYKFNTLRMPD